MSSIDPEIGFIELDCEDIILLIIEANERLLGKNGLSGITRLEKLLFLLEKETEFEGIALLFPFQAYNFGPFSIEVYEAIDFLEGCELITVSEKAYPSYYASAGEAKLVSEIEDTSIEDSDATKEQNLAKEKIFRLTDNGRIVAKKLRLFLCQKSSKDSKDLDMIVLRFSPLPLNQLIRYVYRQYPDMATESKHPEAKFLF